MSGGGYDPIRVAIDAAVARRMEPAAVVVAEAFLIEDLASALERLLHINMHMHHCETGCHIERAREVLARARGKKTATASAVGVAPVGAAGAHAPCATKGPDPATSHDERVVSRESSVDAAPTEVGGTLRPRATCPVCSRQVAVHRAQIDALKVKVADLDAENARLVKLLAAAHLQIDAEAVVFKSLRESMATGEIPRLVAPTEKIDFLGQWCGRHREWTDSPDETRCPVCIHEENEKAERGRLIMMAAENHEWAIRSVLAAQWASACVAAAFFETHGGSWVVAELAKTLAELPCAVDIVDGAACSAAWEGPC